VICPEKFGGKKLISDWNVHQVKTLSWINSGKSTPPPPPPPKAKSSQRPCISYLKRGGPV
jgi:hypothetical protein